MLGSKLRLTVQEQCALNIDTETSTYLAVPTTKEHCPCLLHPDIPILQFVQSYTRF